MINLENVDGLVKTMPASNDEIRIVENEMNILLPEIHKELLKYTNGFSTDSGLVIYGTDDIVERNLTLEVDEYAKGYIAIGDDSGDIVFLVSKDDTKKEVLSVGCGDMNPSNAKVVAYNLSKWLDDGCNFSDMNGENAAQTYNKYCNILLVDNPKGGLKDLVKIKNVLNVEMSSAEILKASKNLPFPIISNISYGKALNYLEKLNEFSQILQLEGLSK